MSTLGWAEALSAGEAWLWLTDAECQEVIDGLCAKALGRESERSAPDRARGTTVGAAASPQYASAPLVNDNARASNRPGAITAA